MHSVFCLKTPSNRMMHWSIANTYQWQYEMWQTSTDSALLSIATLLHVQNLHLEMLSIACANRLAFLRLKWWYTPVVWFFIVIKLRWTIWNLTNAHSFSYYSMKKKKRLKIWAGKSKKCYTAGIDDKLIRYKLQCKPTTENITLTKRVW